VLGAWCLGLIINVVSRPIPIDTVAVLFPASERRSFFITYVLYFVLPFSLNSLSLISLDCPTEVDIAVVILSSTNGEESKLKFTMKKKTNNKCLKLCQQCTTSDN
jgi:hypothetical protein